MKRIKHLFTALLLLFSVAVNAEDFEVNGIYYNIIDATNKTVAVTYRGYYYDSYYDEYTGSVVIPESVTCNDVTYSVTSIGREAFCYCSGLISIVIPYGVTSIGGAAFRGCSGLTSVEIPNSVTSIGDYAFYECSGLTSIVIPNSVTSVGHDAFCRCSGLKILEILGAPTLEQGAFSRTALEELVLPEGITLIPIWCFDNSPNLRSVTIPTSVTSIGKYAFEGCSGLASIEIPNSVTSIGDAAFRGCSGLKTVINHSSLAITKGSYNYGYVGYYADEVVNTYIHVSSVTLNNSRVTVEKGHTATLSATVSPVDATDKTVMWRTSDENIATVDENGVVTAVNAGSATITATAGEFTASCEVVVVILPTGVALDNTVLTVEKGHTATLSATVSPVDATDKTVMWRTSDENIATVDENGVVTAVNAGSATITATAGEFTASCEVVVVILPTGVALDNTVLTVEKGHTATLSATVSPVDATDKTVMWRTSDENIATVDENGVVTAVNAGSATITATAGEFTASCEVVVIETSGSCGENVSWKLAGDILTLYGTGEMQDYAGETPWGWCCETIENIVVEKGITSIGANAFNGCKSVTSIEIPVGVESIGAAAFKNCTALAYISIPNSVKDIADKAFEGCTNLKKVELNTTTVENWFSGYTSIKEIVTGNSVTSIVGGAFSGCTNLASLTVGSKVASFGTNAFNGCGNIIKVFWLGNTPPAGYEQLSGKINYVANNQYTNLSGEVVVSQFLSSKFEIDGTVYVPTSLSDRTCCIVDYDILSDVSDVAIEETVSYQGVSLKVQDINPYSFYGKENLSTVTFAHNGGIGTSAFEGCASLAAIEIPNIVTYVDDYAFRNCTKLTAAKINNRETVLPLGMQLFANTAIESLYIDSKISYEESDREISPFSESSTLKSVVITNAESNIYDYEFYNCTALESAVVGDGVEKIGRWAFSGCLNLKDFVFGSNLEEIGEEAFSDCSGLVQITGRAVLPPVCGDQALDDINKWTCKLYVPAVNLAAYQEADQWKEFIFVEELVTTDNYVTYKIDGEVYKTLLIKPGERIITPTVDEKEGYTFSGWDLSEYISADGYPVMPAEDIVVEASFYITGIDEVKTEPTVDASQNEKVKTVYDLNGRRIVDAEYLERGVYIVNGKKILVKY